MDKMVAKCPTCKKKVEGKALVRAYFGLRWMNNIEKPQSYCKNCRVKHRMKSLNNKCKLKQC